MVPMVDGGETTGSANAKPGGSPASTVQVVDMAGAPAAVSWVEMGPMKVLVTGKGPEESMRGPRRRKSPKSSSVKGISRMTGMVREGGGTGPPKRIPGTEGSQGVKPQGLMR